MNIFFLKNTYKEVINNFFIRKNFSRVNMDVSKKSKGFSIIEMVVVIAIVGFLSTIIYSSFDSSKAQSRDQKRVSDVSAIQLALEQYFSAHGVYPLQLSDLVPTYISEMSKDPTTKADYSGNYFPMAKILAPNSNSCVSYQLWTKFEKSNPYIDQKKGFNSISLPTGWFECGSGHSKINASASGNSLIYDVMP